MGRDQRGRVPDALGQEEADDADTSEPEDSAVAERAKAGSTQSIPQRKDFWCWTAPDKLCRMHYVPRLVAYTPVRMGCPVDAGKLSDTRRTYAYNLTTRRSVKKVRPLARPRQHVLSPF